MTPAPPTRFELSLGDAYAGMLWSWRIHDRPHAAQFARAILKHAETYPKTPRKWLMNAVAIDRWWQAHSRRQSAAEAILASGEGFAGEGEG